MYAVIFRAEIIKLDSRYSQIASRLREIAISQYGCTEFTSVTDGLHEIAISYWNSLDQIQKWKQHSKHLVAQELGQSTWYKSYKVQVTEVIREYSKNP